MIRTGKEVMGSFLVGLLNKSIQRDPQLEFVQAVIALSPDYQTAIVLTKDGKVDEVEAKDLLPEVISVN